jgi:cytochrome P450
MSKEAVERLAARFDHHDPTFARDNRPWEVYAVLRERCPVAHSDAWEDGFYVLSKYADVARVARDPETFSSRWGITIPGGLPGHEQPPEPSWLIPIALDPPEWNEWRKLLNQFFAPQAMARFVPGMRQLASDLIDQFIERGSADLYDELLAPFPAIITCRILGLPEEEWHDFAGPVHDSMQAPPDRNQATADAIPPHMVEPIRRMIEIALARRDDPRDDVLSFLGQAEVHGRPVNELEMAAITNVLLSGGVDTTTNATGVTLVELARRPELRRRLVEDPTLIPMAIEEFLRMWAPFQGLARRVMADVEVGGCPMKEGDKVLMLWASANRDPDEFDNADELIIDRSPNRHLAFGLGPHRCLGAHFARAEIQVALEEVLRRLPDYEIEESGLQVARDVGLIYGYSKVPIKFTPGTRVSS